MMRLHIRFLIFLSALILISGCKPIPKNNTDSMIVIGKIEGLRKGKLYLQKIKDTLLINIDSTLIKGTPNFSFEIPIETAEIFYLYLEKEDGDSLNDRILFFGEKGTIEINTLLNTFESSAEIKGSKNQELLQEYLSFNKKFNDQNLELIEGFYNAQLKKNSKQSDSLQQKIDNLLRRRYLYTINFAVQNSNQNISPYIALTEVYDANLSLLDSIAIKMTTEVRNSKYGIEFMNYLEERRSTEKK